MYQEHPLLQSPDNEHVKIWRYLELPKFLSMLEKGALYFVRADKFPDKFEGTYPEAGFQDPNYSSEEKKNLLKEKTLWMKGMMSSLLRLNCWNIYDEESELLWKSYIRNSGVAIQSTFRKLKECFAITAEEVEIGIVKYIDYAVYSFPPNNIFSLVFHKRKFYEMENELRACVMLGTSGTKIVDLNRAPIGLHIQANLNTLIEKIVLYLGVSSWFKELIESIARKYEVNKEIRFSAISEKPT